MSAPGRIGWSSLCVLAAAVCSCQPPSPAPASPAVVAPASEPPRVEAEPPAHQPEPVPDEEVGTLQFRDATDQSGIHFVHTSGRSEQKLYPTLFGSGVAMLDYDGDGLLDLYFASNRELPLDAPSKAMGNRLYHNLGGGKFEDVTKRAGVGFAGFTTGLAVGDLNNDGLPDLYLATFGANVIYLNNGNGTFHNASAGSGAEIGLWSSGVAMLDYDGDGWLDLYVSCYGQWTVQGPHPFCGDLARKIRTVCSPMTIVPERHFLFRNRHDGTFEDVTERAGILRQDGRGMGVLAADLNRDGKIDLFVANDLCPNFLFLNRGDGTFADLTRSAGTCCSEAGENQSGMGVDAEDLTGDGLPELTVSHYRGEYLTLYQNLDGRNYHDVSASAGVVRESLPYVGWGCALADFDSDGEPDLMVVNGHVEDNLPAVGQDVPYAEPSRVWRNVGAARFRAVKNAGSFFETDHVARGAAFGDIDNDGDLDVVVSLMDAGPAVLRNESPHGHWVGLDLRGTRSNRSAIGALVELHAGDRTLYRQVKGGGSYYSANDTRLLIGLGQARQVERVEIRWPSGTRTTLRDLELGRVHRVVEAETGP